MLSFTDISGSFVTDKILSRCSKFTVTLIFSVIGALNTPKQFWEDTITLRYPFLLSKTILLSPLIALSPSTPFFNSFSNFMKNRPLSDR